MSAALQAQKPHHRASSATSKVSKASSKAKSHRGQVEFIPCAATASFFLYAQDSTILCCHHDTLSIERKFTKHTEPIKWIIVDNVSERGAGRLAVSCDVGQTAIIWDLFTGSEISHFTAYEPITAAAWMRNGNIAFGNSKGDVILFDPSSSKNASIRTIYDPVTSIAPAADCRTFAIGYENGTMILASLQPALKILHTLSTGKAPASICGMAWHSSSAKQKSDMLATQTQDGDLRVWSVAKPPGSEQPRVIRILKRSDSPISGLHWMGWSKNGRIIQYSDRETWSWDVRTKHVSFISIPTIEDVRAIANYGSTATLFTLGPNHSVQQYDVESPQLVANTQHFPGRPEDSMSIPSISASESEDDYMEPYGSVSVENMPTPQARNQIYEIPKSTGGSTFTSSSRASSITSRHRTRTERSGTTFSMGTTRSHMTRQSLVSGSSLGYPESLQSPASTRSYRKGTSRLRHEVARSPDENKPLTELFPWTRQRLFNIQYKPLPAFDAGKMTRDALRQQMLSVVFGWEEDIESLVRHEMQNHQEGSPGQLLLAKWLNDEADILASMLGSSNSGSNLDWMLLALTSMGEKSKTIGQALAQKMLAKGDVHTAVTILISLGEIDMATQVYVSGHYYMEAILLTCLMKRNDWRAQAGLVRLWGEHVVSNSQQHLALRCFSVTGPELSGMPQQPPPPPPQLLPYAQSTLPEQKFKGSSSQSVVSDSLSSVPTTATPVPSVTGKVPSPTTRLQGKMTGLKLITQFGPPESEKGFKFPGLQTNDQTPIAMAGSTPIADTAPDTLHLRERHGASMRPRLASIGESPVDFVAPKPLPTPDNSEGHALASNTKRRSAEDAPLLLSSAKYDPTTDFKKETPLTALPTTAVPTTALPTTAVPSTAHPDNDGSRSPSQAIFEALSRERAIQPGSNNRTGLTIQWPPAFADIGPNRSDTPASYTTAQLDAQSSILSPPSTTISFDTTQTRSYAGTADETSSNYFSKHHRKIRSSKRSVPGSVTADSITGSEISDYRRLKHRHHRDHSEESRGRRQYQNHVQVGKRSPTSPKPMAALLGLEPPTTVRRKHDKARSRSQPREKIKVPSAKGYDSPEDFAHHKRGRPDSTRGSAGMGSPSSPKPMTPAGEDFPPSVPSEGPFRFVAADMAGRQEKKRSTRGHSARRDDSNDRRRARSRSRSRHANSTRPRGLSLSERSEMTSQDWIAQRSVDNTPRPVETIVPSTPIETLSNISLAQYDPIVRPATTNPRFVSESKRKELAAAELEARRASLLRRSATPQTASMSQSSHHRSLSFSDPKMNPPPFLSPNDSESSSPNKGTKFGLPSTPRAMRLANEDPGPGSKDTTDVLTLTDAVYKPDFNPISRSMSVPIESSYRIPTQATVVFPAHPAFQEYIPKSRSSSRHGRNLNGERRISPNLDGPLPEAPQEKRRDDEHPPILPQLQHLAASRGGQNMLPPPPPPPPPPMINHISDGGIGTIDIVFDHPGGDDDSSVQIIEIPDNDNRSSAGAQIQVFPLQLPPRPSAGGHRRNGSTGSTFIPPANPIDNAISNKFKSMADRIRSSSKPRGTGPRSPPVESAAAISPYESIPPMPNGMEMGNMI